MSGFVHIRAALEQPRQHRVTGSKLVVYALVDLRDHGIRYIGVTNKTLKDRLNKHLRWPTNAAMRTWFQGLAASGLTPEIVQLEAVHRDEWESAERGWIFWCRQRGQLLNVDRGGKARTPAGKLRPFKAGMYQEARGRVRTGEPLPQPKRFAEGPKHPVAGERPRTRPENRPRLVPVAEGVFRRAG